MKKNRPYKYNAKSRLTPNSQSFPFKVNHIKNDVVTNLENTLTKLRIIDDTQVKKESLDDGFLRGRADRKEENKKKKKKEVSLAKREKLVQLLSILKKIVLSISAVGAVLVLVMLGYHFIEKGISHYRQSKNQSVLSGNRMSVIDDNYLFVGDFHTKLFAFDSYGFDYHYVKEGGSNLTTSELLNQMKSTIYDYNPSVILMEVGMMDIDQGVPLDEFIDNYGKILDSITMNRPNAMVYIESIYPINQQLYDGDYIQNAISNQEIKAYNQALKTLAIEKNVSYLDLYSKLEKGNRLNSQYTDDGVSLNQKGYQVVYQEIKSIIGKD